MNLYKNMPWVIFNFFKFAGHAIKLSLTVNV